ncbi:hypothetical protein [Dyadobacter pollutisoli]|uniref:Uncharacterized protein n=1 Tax=Dyadobacter pollutisoli TaxID=2910158 RepID=A0A9E8NEX3_9BACT|nr:hypothetical protein [Dyadobacter pollutisoli]WAC13047.1 hypothetical protein ON006_03595 [Dyadobacter pollutisoli]
MAYNRYFSSRELRRKADILLSADGHYTSGKWSFSAGPLLISGNDKGAMEPERNMLLWAAEGLP